MEKVRFIKVKVKENVAHKKEDILFREFETYVSLDGKIRILPYHDQTGKKEENKCILVIQGSMPNQVLHSCEELVRKFENVIL